MRKKRRRQDMATMLRVTAFVLTFSFAVCGIVFISRTGFQNNTQENIDLGQLKGLEAQTGEELARTEPAPEKDTEESISEAAEAKLNDVKDSEIFAFSEDELEKAYGSGSKSGKADLDLSGETAEEESEEVIPTQNTDVEAVLENEEVQENPEATTPEAINVSEEQETAAPAVPETDALKFAGKLNWPIQGDVILDYSMEQAIYFQTLKQYRCNPAMMIRGKENQDVHSAADGVVTHVTYNEETGNTLTVDLGDGYEAVYGQLNEITWKEGDQIKSGDLLGTLAAPTNYYSEEGTNLYFQIQKDEKPVDPKEYLKK